MVQALLSKKGLHIFSLKKWFFYLYRTKNRILTNHRIRII